MKVGVVIPTFGDEAVWGPLAQRALESVERQTRPPTAVLHLHSTTLQAARNAGAMALDGCDYLIFLDADDELEEHYVEKMVEAAEANRSALDRRHFIFRPNTQGIHEDGTITIERPSMIPVRNLRTGNYIVIGAMCDRQLFLDVGGFGDYPCLEDWALWRAMVACGAEVVDVPEAIYQIHIRPNSRNAPGVEHSNTYRRIRRDIPL